MKFDDDLSLKICSRSVAEILMRRATETIGAAVNASAITVNRVIKRDVRTIVMANDRTGLRFFKDFDLGLRRFAYPLDGVSQPGIWRVSDITHECNPVLQMKQRIAELIKFGERKSIAGADAVQSSSSFSLQSIKPTA